MKEELSNVFILELVFSFFFEIIWTPKIFDNFSDRKIWIFQLQNFENSLIFKIEHFQSLIISKINQL